MKRVFFIVLDSLGIGAAPDAEHFGDIGADTLGRISKSKKFHVPNLERLGLFNIDGVNASGGVENPLAAYARLREMSMGKDTTVGHWELSGIYSERPLPTYPYGFPEDVLDAFKKAVGRGVLCNKPYSGTEVIKDYGEEHIKSGNLIVYTSADSVFQIAAHEEIVPVAELYDICRKAREILIGEHAVGRVIARPFIGEVGNFTRTANRRDFSVEAPRETLLDALCKSGFASIAVGKITDIFASRGITESIFTHGNREGMNAAARLLDKDFSGLAFVNLVDFDMLYGHRQDIDGYASALSEFDAWLGGFIEGLGEDDILIISADHGCDPGDASTDHTREYVPLLVYGDKIEAKSLGTISGFGTVANLISRHFSLNYFSECGEEIYQKIIKM